MTKLITLADIRTFKGITLNANIEKKLDPNILEAQGFDLRRFMGESFYLALLDDFEASPSLSEYSDLFNGLRYTYQGKQYEHEGLKAILCYHTWARYEAGQGSGDDTAFGRVHKSNQFSERVSEKTITRLYTQARSGATVHEQRVREYLDRFSSQYPLWECGTKSPYKSGTRIKSIG